MELERGLKEVAVTALQLPEPLVLDAETSISDVVSQMRESGQGYAILMSEGRLAGILTERDVLVKVVGQDRPTDAPASRFMTPDPVCVRADDPIHKAVWHMHDGGFRSVPVLGEDGAVVGCVRHRDLIRFLVEHLAEHVLNLPPDPEQLARSPEGG